MKAGGGGVITKGKGVGSKITKNVEMRARINSSESQIVGKNK